MQILAHRGFWREKKEQNSLASLAKAFEMGFGIETDLRDGDRKSTRLNSSHRL